MEGFTTILKDIQKRLDEQKNDLQNIKVNIIQSVNENIDEKFAALDVKHRQLEEKIIKQEKQLNNQEKYNRRKNIILYGVDEGENGYHELEKLVVEILNRNTRYKFDNCDIESVRRLGKKTGKNRPILITFLTLGKKIHLLKNKKYFQDTTYYVKEDFPPDVREKRKQLKEQLKEEIEKGNKGILRYDRLVILNDSNTHHEKHRNKPNMSVSPDQIHTNMSKNSHQQLRNNNRKKKTKTKVSEE